MDRTNCKNCGAPLHYNKDEELLKCDYCGSEYEFIPTIKDFRQVIKFYIGGRVRKFYISEIRCTPITETFRTFVGDTYTTTIQNDEFEINLISYD